MGGIPNNVRILVIDDHPLFRKGVVQLMELNPRFDVVGEAASGAKGLELAAGLRPELVLLDLHMPGMTGIDTLKGLKELEPSPRVVLLTVSDSEEDLIAALRGGADGYLLKEMEPEEIVSSLEGVCTGRVVLSEPLTGMLAHALRAEHGPSGWTEAELTVREVEILGYIANGLSNKRIAREMEITENTVKVHVRHVLKKLNLRSRLEAAIWAIEKRQSDPDHVLSGA